MCFVKSFYSNALDLINDFAERHYEDEKVRHCLIFDNRGRLILRPTVFAPELDIFLGEFSEKEIKEIILPYARAIGMKISNCEWLELIRYY